jgi:alpha-2-macroglobulin
MKPYSPVVFVVLLVCIALAETRRGYLLTAPKVLQTGSEETVCVSFHDLDTDVDLALSLLHEKSEEILASQRESFPNGDGRCFQFMIPDVTSAIDKAVLHVNGSSMNYSFEESTLIGLKRTSLLTFIQTDKPVYKPGQTVKFRILRVDQDLKPKLDHVDEVWIENPAGTRIMQWKPVVTQQGLADLQMALSTEPVLGSWKISAKFGEDIETLQFKVDEYVLPKYEVLVKMPSYVMVNAEKIEGEICAKYTYGKPVSGHMAALVCVKQPYHGSRRRPCAVIKKKEIDGCSSFSVNSREVQLSSDRYSLWGATVAVTASVEEDGTGVVQNGTSDHTKVEQRALKINLEDYSKKYFKPGIKYHGKCSVTRPDGQPAAQETIQLSVHNYATQVQFKRNYTTDDNGEFSYVLPKMGNKVTSFSIRAVAPFHQSQNVHRSGLYYPHEPRGYHFVKKWFSPSGSFLQISPIEETLDCDRNMQVKVQYTTDASSDFKVFYQVISRGNIVWTGHKRSIFQHEGQGKSPEEFQENSEEISDEDLEGEELDIDVEPRKKLDAFRARRSTKHKQGRKRKVLSHLAEFHIDVPVTAKMAPAARLLVYYIRADGETVADSVEFQVSKCFNNSVSLDFSDEQVRPGGSVTLELTAATGSLCAVGIVDKSALLLESSNQLSAEKIFGVLQSFQLQYNQPYLGPDTYCQDQLHIEGKAKEDEGNKRNPRPIPARGRQRRPRRHRSKRMIMPDQYYSDFYDSRDAFKDHRVVTLSDLVIDTRPCRKQEIYLRRSRVQFHPAPGAARPAMASSIDVLKENVNGDKTSPGKGAVDIRTYFPETWLWDLYPIQDSGELEVEQTIPHTITKWVGNAFCTSSEAGLGVADTATVTAFQPFFASFNLPYSVIRGEKVPVVVSVFNYLSECLVVQLVLKKEPGYKIFGERNAELCVCGSQSKTHTFHIMPRLLGDVNITVKAESAENTGVCGNDLIMSNMVGVRDAVTRKLRIEPEGHEEEYTFSSYDCIQDGKTTEYTVKMPLPEDLVPDSARGFVSVIGDVMGPALGGLDSLLRLPSGCGEQNMLKFAPNIYILRYLDSTQQTSAAIRAKAVSFMNTGYQRELTYKHADGSYSAFGEKDEEGSTWLTAFVLKSFAQAQPYIYIDEKEINASIQWFRLKQLENGCFPHIGMVHHQEMKGGLAGDSDSFAPLTAYVLAALLEAGIPSTDPLVADAMLCLESQNIEDIDVYTTALMAYAYTLYDSGSAERADIMDKLNTMASHSGGTTHWEKPTPPSPTPGEDGWFVSPYYQAPSADVEMSAYALMGHIHSGETDSITDALPIVQWLSKQRNGNGGFSSTQDTVVALQALAEFASRAYSGNGKGINASIEIISNIDSLSEEYIVMPDNSLLLQKTPVDVPNELFVKLNGAGCLLIQASVKYNIFNVSQVDTPAFLIKADVRRVKTHRDHCRYRRLDICTKYNKDGQVTNMAVVVVKMVSGWIPVKESIKELEKQNDNSLKRVEVDHNKVNFYFDELDSSYQCINMEIEQDIEVSQAKPAAVQVYDYYQQEIASMVEYRIHPYCGTKEELPFLTPEEYDAVPDNPDEISQKRVPVKFPFGDLKSGLAGLRGESPVNSDGVQVVLEEPPCPNCLMDIPGDLIETFCASKYAYKVELRKKGAIMKFITDIRPKKGKKVLNLFVDRHLPEGCQCDVLQTTSKRTYALILSEEESVEKQKGNKGTLPLTSAVTIIKMNDKKHLKELEKQLNRARKRTCSS